MKLNKNKIIVSALALAIGGSLAGSVGSTIAWYQYSTRANVSFLGKASGVSSNLQMRFVGENDTKWRTRITFDELETKIGSFKLAPMTFGAFGKDAALPAKGYIQPAPGVGSMAKWGEAEANKHYAQFQLQLRNINREGDTAANDAQDVYLSKLVIQEDAKNGATKEDLSDAIRVHISADGGATPINKLISNKGGDTKTSGKLDIDGDGADDQAYPEGDEFGFGYTGDTRNQLADVIYGDQNTNGLADEVQSSYIASYESTATNPALVFPDEDNVLYDDETKAAEPAATKSIGKTLASESSYLTVTVTIWVEGWQEFNDSAIWNATKYIDSQFNVGIQFAVQDRQ